MQHPIFDYLSRLEQNNNKIWFEANRKEFESTRNELIAIASNLIEQISAFDESLGQLEAKKCIFRQNRDVRFSKNKKPYKTTMSAYFAPGGKSSSSAGYYLHLEPGKSFAGGGIYSPQPDILKAIRTEIYFNGSEFESIINDKEFINVFGELMNEKLLRPPKSFPPEFPQIELLKYKHYVVSRNFDLEKMNSADIESFAIETFKSMFTFNSFLNRAVNNAE
ncbi:MAG: DUF2461 domain-containing protein [Bacteroidetes bacterium]|nr:DUF2461 domain-containing protein [Bacteroidota bacterium]